MFFQPGMVLYLLFNIKLPWAWGHLWDKSPPLLDLLLCEAYLLLGFTSFTTRLHFRLASPFPMVDFNLQGYCKLMPGCTRYLSQEWERDSLLCVTCWRWHGVVTLGPSILRCHQATLSLPTTAPMSLQGQRLAVIVRQELGGKSREHIQGRW